MRRRMRVIHSKAEVEEISLSSLSQAQGRQWDSLWHDGITPWDLGRSTPALISELDRHYDSSSLLVSDNIPPPPPPPRHCFIPGCGSGYDLVALAHYFQRNRTTTTKSQPNSQQALFQTANPVQYSCSNEVVLVGLEISPTSLDRAHQVIRWMDNDSTSGDSQSEATSSVSCRIELYQGDFFESPSTWQCIMTTKDDDNDDNNALLSSSSSSPPLHYDFVFDYLFFCAIPPELRPNWGQQMAQLLTKRDMTTNPDDQPDHRSVQQGTHHPSGQLLTLMFPYTSSSSSSPQQPQSPGSLKSKPPLTGPPYPVTLEEYRKVLEPHGVMFQGGKEPTTSPDTFPERQGQERVGWWSFQS
jgi:hypothetical protein